jgi:hypothetical protein
VLSPVTLQYLGGFLFGMEFLMPSSMQLCYPNFRNAGIFRKTFFSQKTFFLQKKIDNLLEYYEYDIF